MVKVVTSDTQVLAAVRGKHFKALKVLTSLVLCLKCLPLTAARTCVPCLYSLLQSQHACSHDSLLLLRILRVMHLVLSDSQRHVLWLNADALRMHVLGLMHMRMHVLWLNADAFANCATLMARVFNIQHSSDGAGIQHSSFGYSTFICGYSTFILYSTFI